ncbi:MAG TPA: hypothetical protein VE007_07340, partial [Thermoanaerobaculia bacterium]|nr:hypothetical protein [Thermoanaerobaculia bacterium]
MIPALRARYNAAFTRGFYEEYERRLTAECGFPIEFRLAETPVFLPPELRDEMVRAAQEIWAELMTPENLRRSEAAVPEEWNVPGCDPLPLFAQADFAVVREGGRLAPKLIELQAFPSLYGFQLFQSVIQRDMAPGGEELGWTLSGLGREGYVREVGRAITADVPVENVVLLDLDPPHQKTAVDFSCTEKLWGVRAVDVMAVEKKGRELWYDRDRRRTRILRIYNRLIFDELEASGARLPFDLTSRIDVSWAGHPNWYFRWSKHCLPDLRHPTVPESHFLSDLPETPRDLEGWVLKPLFSFAGSGVKVDVTPADLAAIPPERRGQYLLMRKIDYAPAIPTVDGGASKVEVRVMFVWKNGEPLPVITLARLSQGKMMGVNYNKDKTWVG